MYDSLFARPSDEDSFMRVLHPSVAASETSLDVNNSIQVRSDKIFLNGITRVQCETSDRRMFQERRMNENDVFIERVVM